MHCWPTSTFHFMEKAKKIRPKSTSNQMKILSFFFMNSISAANLSPWVCINSEIYASCENGREKERKKTKTNMVKNQTKTLCCSSLRRWNIPFGHSGRGNGIISEESDHIGPSLKGYAYTSLLMQSQKQKSRTQCCRYRKYEPHSRSMGVHVCVRVCACVYCCASRMRTTELLLMNDENKTQSKYTDRPTNRLTGHLDKWARFA